ncbi:hypothetical protein PN499_03085 [Kamptonema animale CS-326]|uniref:hypothetical protein n=1 Tax=Kamptonema animale TaxID=92934 RepID=UPI00232D6D30|nr:hypothetical protein [Kamptonema animale]MDB9510193.1 hypothetical protein [Kamptonema animale CS-326]
MVSKVGRAIVAKKHLFSNRYNKRVISGKVAMPMLLLTLKIPDYFRLALAAL